MSRSIAAPAGSWKASSAFPEGLARLYFYDAVRAAPSSERVLSLLGVAEQLDRIDPGSHLATYVRRIASRDFSQRGPLAKTYSQVALGTLPPAEPPAAGAATEGLGG